MVIHPILGMPSASRDIRLPFRFQMDLLISDLYISDWESWYLWRRLTTLKLTFWIRFSTYVRHAPISPLGFPILVHRQALRVRCAMDNHFSYRRHILSYVGAIMNFKAPLPISFVSRDTIPLAFVPSCSFCVTFLRWDCGQSFGHSE